MLNKQFFKVERSNFTNQTFKWMPADTEENYKKIIQNTTVPYGPNDIDYKYNNYGFRCDNFESWKNYPYRILYAGCSMTEGVGLPLKDSWPKLLHNTICKSFNVEIPYWTIAVGGTGMDQMVRYFYNIKDFLRPQIVISYLPGLERRELYYETRWAVWNLDTVEGKNTRIFLDENLVSYQSEKNIAMLDLILKDIDSLFLFSSSIEDFEIKDYIDSPRFIQTPHIPEEFKIDLARDGIHPGPKSNQILAEQMFEYNCSFIKQKLGI